MVHSTFAQGHILSRDSNCGGIPKSPSFHSGLDLVASASVDSLVAAQTSTLLEINTGGCSTATTNNNNRINRSDFYSDESSAKYLSESEHGLFSPPPTTCHRSDDLYLASTVLNGVSKYGEGGGGDSITTSFIADNQWNYRQQDRKVHDVFGKEIQMQKPSLLEHIQKRSGRAMMMMTTSPNQTTKQTIRLCLLKGD